MPNLRAGFVIMASLPASIVLFISELLAEWVALIPLDGSTIVEGTVCPTTISSPDDTIYGILAAGLKKIKTQNQWIDNGSSWLKSTSNIPIFSSLWGATSLSRSWASTHWVMQVSSLRLGLFALSSSLADPAASALSASLSEVKLSNSEESSESGTNGL